MCCCSWAARRSRSLRSSRSGATDQACTSTFTSRRSSFQCTRWSTSHGRLHRAWSTSILFVAVSVYLVEVMQMFAVSIHVKCVKELCIMLDRCILLRPYWYHQHCGPYPLAALSPSLTSFFLLFSSPNLSHRRLDVYHTSTHGVALVRI